MPGRGLIVWQRRCEAGRSCAAGDCGHGTTAQRQPARAQSRLRERRLDVRLLRRARGDAFRRIRSRPGAHKARPHHQQSRLLVSCPRAAGSVVGFPDHIRGQGGAARARHVGDRGNPLLTNRVPVLLRACPHPLWGESSRLQNLCQSAYRSPLIHPREVSNRVSSSGMSYGRETSWH